MMFGDLFHPIQNLCADSTHSVCAKFFFISFFKMLTRKRHRDHLLDQKFNAYTYEFDPIRESVAKFLDFKDVASIVRLNLEYSKKTWIVVLNNSTRVNACIHVKTPKESNKSSWSWIVKYAKHLKYQKLTTSANHSKFFQLRILVLDTLIIEYCDIPIQLPKQLKELRVNDCFGDLPNLDGILCLIGVGRLCQDINLQKLPSSLMYLYLKCYLFDTSKFSILPNLTTLTLNECWHFCKMNELHIKCPNIQTLTVSDVIREDLNGLQGLKISRLVIDCEHEIDLKVLQEVDVKHLVFEKKCTWITQSNIRKLNHIPDIKCKS